MAQSWQHWSINTCKAVMDLYHSGVTIQNIAKQLELSHVYVGKFLRSRGMETHAGARQVFCISEKEIARRATIEREKHYIQKRKQKYVEAR